MITFVTTGQRTISGVAFDGRCPATTSQGCNEFCDVLNQFGLCSLIVGGLGKVELGVRFPVRGFCAGFDPLLLTEATAGLTAWAAARPIRSAADLARPLQ